MSDIVGIPESPMEVMVMNTDRGVQSGASGYARLVEHLGNACLVTAQRSDPTSFISRLSTRVLRVGAANTWYRIGSLKTEWNAKRLMSMAVPNVVHLLWGDQDWGYIDRFLPPETAFVITVHNPPELLPQNFHRTSALKRVDRVILMSPDQIGFFENLGIPKERCVFVPHGIDTEVFHPGTQLPDVNQGKLRVLHVGNYLRDFEALAVTTRQLADQPLQFEIVCSRENRSNFQYGSNVSWYHGISNEALLELYQSCDVLLMTATGATANNALLEGMACGLPVIAQDVGGLKDYLSPACALLVDPTAEQELSKAVIGLLDNREQISVMGLASRTMAETLSWERITEQTKDVYRGAMAERINCVE